MKAKITVKDKTLSKEWVKVDFFRKNTRKTAPHKHNSYFELIYLTRGAGVHTIDFIDYEISTPILFSIRKEQLHYWDIKTEPEGFVVIIKKEFINNCLDPELLQLITRLSAHNCFHPKDEALSELFVLLYRECCESIVVDNVVIAGLLKAVFAKVLSSSVLSRRKETLKVSLYTRFLDLLVQRKNQLNKVSDFAELLNTSPQNLNAICRKTVNQSAKELLDEHIISEAKRLLLYTDLSILEVSFHLNFKDNSHFSKFFKRIVGLTPKEYREEN